MKLLHENFGQRLEEERGKKTEHVLVHPQNDYLADANSKFCLGLLLLSYLELLVKKPQQVGQGPYRSHLGLCDRF